MKRKNFTKEEILEIRRLYFDERLSKEKIGREFGCSEQVIRRLFNQQGWESRRQGESSKLSDEEFRRLDQLGISDEEIEQRSGLTHGAINYRRRKLGLNKPKGPIPKLSNTDLYELHHIEGISIAELSRTFYDVPFSTSLRDRAIQLGIYSQDDDWIEDRKNPIHIHDGYAKVKIPEHPRADDKGYVLMHVVVMETKLGRYLNYVNQDGEQVHHIDCNKIHNARTNLLKCDNTSMHQSIHKQLDKCLSKLIKKGIIDFDETERCYNLNFNNPTPKPSYIPPKNATRTGGYFQVVSPGHHRVKDDRDRVLLHIIIAEKKYGRNILEGEPIHHIDLDKLNNSKENLFLCKNENEHNQLIQNDLLRLVRKLFDKGILVFNRVTNEYEITCCKNITSKKNS